MPKAHPKHIWLRDLFLLFILVTPALGQFTLPFLYMPLKRLLTNRLANEPKHLKLTTEHVRILNGWSLEETYSKSLKAILDGLPLEFFRSYFTAVDLLDFNHYWSYEIPFADIANSSLLEEDKAFTLKPAHFQQALLKFTSEKFLFAINDVALRLGIPAINLSHSYNPGDWETVVRAMISESSPAFSSKLQLPSVDALAQLVNIETQELLNLNLSTFEDLVFPFPPKKAILDSNTTSMTFKMSGIPEAWYASTTLLEALKHDEINLSLRQFGILYNTSSEQVKTLERSTLNQIYHMCKIPMKEILNQTLPAISQKVVGSVSHSPPCPVLIKIKGNSISSFQANSIIITERMTVLEILTTIAILPWHAVRWSVDASLSDWEIVDAVTLPQLAGISGYGVESLRNDSVSESVKLVFSLRANTTLNSRMEAYRGFIRGVLTETFNLTLSEVATLTEMPDASLQNVSSPFLFKSFFNATVIYFKLNLGEIITALQMTVDQLYSLPRQDWNKTFPVIVNAVVQMKAAKLQMSTENMFQFLGFTSNELSIPQLKELIRTRIHDVEQKKMKFESDPISWYLTNNSVSDADYLNTSVQTLLISASGFTDVELKLIYNLNPDQLFILGGMRFSDLPRVCNLDTSTIKERPLYNITTELVGIRESRAVCKITRFYVEARHKNMSYLQTAFGIIENSTIPFVNLVEMVTGLPWRQNVWAFGLKMEDWRVLYVLNQDTFKKDTGFTEDEFLSKTFQQVFQRSLQFQTDNDPKLRVREIQSREQTLNILYKLFNTNEDELIRFSGKSKAEYDVLFPIEVIPLVYKYLISKFNVSLTTLEESLNLKPGELNKLAPTEWSELIPLVKTEVIRSGRQQLDVSLSNFAKLLEETSGSLQNLTLAHLESKWDNTFSRLFKGKRALEKESLLQFLTSIGVIRETVEDVTVLVFVEDKINLTKGDLLLLYNFSAIGIEVLGNYTFKEVTEYCELSKDDLYNKTTNDIVVSLLGHNNDVKCRKVALLVAAATITVDELVGKFNLNVKDDISMLMMFEDLFQLPWPKIAWAINASLPEWPVLGATSLSNISKLVSETVDNLKRLESFRKITSKLLALPQNSYVWLLNDYRSMLKSKAFDLFNVNSSKVCDGCDIVNILWNSLTQLNSQIDFDIHLLPNELNIFSYEFNLTVPSRWSLIVSPIVKGAYANAAQSLGMDPDRLSTLLDVHTQTVKNMTLKEFHVVLEQSIRPFIAGKTALTNSSLLDLIVTSGKNFSAVLNDSIFDVIDSLIGVPIQNLTFIFNWTAEQQAKLMNYTIDDMVYYRGEGARNESLLTLASFVLKQTLPPRTPTPPTLAPCKRGLTRWSDNVECTDVNECPSGLCGADSHCQNYYGGFDCECKVPGHFKVNAVEKCKPCKTFKGFLTITNKEFGPLLKNKESGYYFDLKEEFETTVNEEFRQSSINRYYYGCRVDKLRNGSIIVDYLIFTSPEFTGSLQDIQNALTARFNNSQLGAFTVKTPIVEDFDECKTHRDDCGQHGTCVNTEGSFDCKCNDGYDGDGRTCEAGFLKTMWWTVIVAAFLLLIVVIIVVCLVVKRPKPSGRYGLDADDSLSNQPNRRSSEASKISYRNGDVYYKDKDGKLRPGTAHSSTSQGNGGPHPPHFVADDDNDDDFEPSGRMRAKTPFELAVEKNSRNGNLYEQGDDFKLSEMLSTGTDGAVYSTVKN